MASGDSDKDDVDPLKPWSANYVPMSSRPFLNRVSAVYPGRPAVCNPCFMRALSVHTAKIAVSSGFSCAH